MTNTHSLSGGDIEFMPPLPMLLGEDLPLRGLEVALCQDGIPMEQTVQVIASPSAHLDQATTVGHE